MNALNQQFLRIFASPFQSARQRAAFEQFIRDSGVIPTMVVCVLGFTLMTLVYVGTGLFGTNGEGWFGGHQRYRVMHLGVISTVMLAMGFVWQFWRNHWNVIAYLVLIIGFSFSPVQTFLSAGSDGAWRWLAAYFVFMTALFGFLRLPLLMMVAVSLISSALVLGNLQASYGLDSLMVALTIGTHLLGIGLWLSNRWRDRLLFEQKIASEEIARLERLQDEASRVARRQLVLDIEQPMAALSLQIGLMQRRQHDGLLSDDVQALCVAFDVLQRRVNEVEENGPRATQTKLSSPGNDGVMPRPSFRTRRVNRPTTLSGALRDTWVLVVSNEVLVSMAMVKVFEYEGANVISAATTQEAIERVRIGEWPMELLVCDYLLDEKDTGLDLIRQLRRDSNENTPAMILSGAVGEIPDVSAEDILVFLKSSGARDLRTEACRLVHDFRSQENA